MRNQRRESSISNVVVLHVTYPKLFDCTTTGPNSRHRTCFPGARGDCQHDTCRRRRTSRSWSGPSTTRRWCTRGRLLCEREGEGILELTVMLLGHVVEIQLQEAEQLPLPVGPAKEPTWHVFDAPHQPQAARCEHSEQLRESLQAACETAQWGLTISCVDTAGRRNPRPLRRACARAGPTTTANTASPRSPAPAASGTL